MAKNEILQFTTEMFSFSESADFLDFLLFFLVPDFSDFSVVLFSHLVMISSAPLLSARSTLDYTKHESAERKRNQKIYYYVFAKCTKRKKKTNKNIKSGDLHCRR